MRSSVNTPPTFRKSVSASRASIASSSEDGTWPIFASSSAGMSKRSSSTGGGGSILFVTPSSPAMRMAEKARYGLQLGSGQRNSTRLAFGLGEYTGMRHAAERLRWEYTRLTGASKPGTSRLYELVVGAANASIERA